MAKRLADLVGALQNRAKPPGNEPDENAQDGGVVGDAAVDVDPALVALRAEASRKIRQADGLIEDISSLKRRCTEYKDLARATEITAEQNKHSKPVVKRSIGSRSYDILFGYFHLLFLL